jgi:hypothetical protein
VTVDGESNAILRIPAVCFLRGPKVGLPVCASQTKMVRSREPETTYCPSNEKVAHVTFFVCPRNTSTWLS